MPYSGPGDDSLPDYVKKLSEKDIRQWVAVFNSAYKSCQADGGKDCEASAFAQANGVVIKGGKRMDIKELWENVKRLFEPLVGEIQERIKDVSSWDGSASRYGSTEAYCKACLINMNTGDPSDWKQALCKLPVKDTDGQPVRQAIHAAAAALSGARGGVDAPPDEKKQAANKIIVYYGQMDETAPDGVYQAAGREQPKREMAVLPMQTRTLTVTRSADGKARWLMIAASAVINRVGAIDSTVLFDNFIKRATETGAYPVLDFYHEGERLRLGQADWLGRDGALYLASGTFDDTDIARAAAHGLETQAGEWGASIAYKPTVEPMELVAAGMIPVYTDGINNFISIVSKRMAANLFTATIATEEVTRMDKKVFDELVKLVGEQAAAPFATMVDEANRTIQETGMVTRADPAPTTQETPTEPAPATDTPVVEPPQPEPEPQQRQDTGAMEEQIKALTDRVAKLEQALAGQSQVEEAKEKRSVDALGALDSRLQAVEKTSQAWADWIAGLPEQRVGDATYRPRDQAENVTATTTPAADLAAQNTASLRNRDPRYVRKTGGA